MDTFWAGFEKKAIRLGIKATQPLSAAGKLVGNKPMAGVSTAAAFKPAPLPTPKPMNPANNTAASPGHAPIKAPAPMPTHKGNGVAATAI